jgi:hypothetical protein
MRICLVFGAGASFANAKHYRPVNKQETLPPLDYTFFQKFAQLGINVPLALRAYAARLPAGSPFGQRDARMEVFIRDVFHDFLRDQDDANSEGVGAYRRLVALYTTVLRQTTDWVRKSTYSGGPVGKLIAEAASVAEHVDVVTFNHDLMIENEIYKRRRISPLWCINRGYGALDTSGDLFSTNGEPHFREHGPDCDHSTAIQVHKMHGSLNWFIKMRARNPTPNILSGRVKNPEVLIVKDRSLREIRAVRMTKTEGRNRWWVWPVIVPPIYGKQALIGAYMPSVWTEARAALEDADRVLFFGYSLPSADIEAEKLFQRSLLAAYKKDLPWIDVIDPSTDVIKRYADILPPVPLRRYPDYDAFFDGPMFG